MEQLSREGRLHEQDVVALAEAGKFEETVVAMSLVADVPIAVVERALISARPELLLMLLKAMEFSWTTVKSHSATCVPKISPALRSTSNSAWQVSSGSSWRPQSRRFAFTAAKNSPFTRAASAATQRCGRNFRWRLRGRFAMHRTQQLGEGTMKFGVFDHMDRGPLPLAEQYENRLKLVEAYDRAGFFCYHLAEHHATPLGMAPSPAVYLSAVAQRTKRMRIGTLVYILSLQNPLRAYEDICMLDHLSGGRLELGIGRGVSPIEIEYYGVNPEESRARYQEAVAVLMQAFSSDAITFHGKHFQFDDSPVEIKPLQRPHPPLWLGIGSAEGIPHAVKNKINMVCNGQSTQVRALTDRYREEWERAGNAAKDIPIIGMNRHIVVADTEAEALKVARPAYASWFTQPHPAVGAQGHSAAARRLYGGLRRGGPARFHHRGNAADGARDDRRAGRRLRHQLSDVPAGVRRLAV